MADQKTQGGPVNAAKASQKRNRATVDPNEPKDVKFRRLANRRVPVAMKRIAQVANLANGSQYESTPEQREKICSALFGAVSAAVKAMRREGKIDKGWTL